MPLQFLQHPLSVHTLLFSMVQDVDLPESEQEFANDGVTHEDPLALRALGRRFASSWMHLGARTQFVRAASSNFITGLEIAEDFH
jgi:hypothetical protein